MTNKNDKKDDLEQIKDQINHGLAAILHDVNKGLKAIRPEGNQQRNLDRETGGVEAKEQAAQAHDEDAWDKRGEEIAKMIHDEQALNNASASGREQSFIHRKKQRKQQEKKIETQEEASEAHAQRVKEARQKAKNQDGRSR